MCSDVAVSSVLHLLAAGGEKDPGQGQGQVQFQSTLTTTQVHQGDQGKKTYQFEHKCKLILDVSVELQKSGAYDCDSNDPSVISL